MRTLSPTLLVAQRGSSRRPYLKVDVLDKIGGVARLRYQRHYTGTEPERFHATTMPSDGSLVRTRIDAPAGYKLYLQRVGNPTPQSDFASWSYMVDVSNSGDVALCSNGSRVLLFYVATNQQTIYARESTDYGQNFGSAVAITTQPSAVTWLAGAAKSNGDAALFFIRSSELHSVKRTSGSWGTPAAWSNSLSSNSGIAAIYHQDWNLMICGEDTSGNPGVWTCIYGDGSAQPVDTWSDLKILTIAENGSDITFSAPFIAKPDVYRATFVEKYAGSASYERPFWSYTAPGAGYSDNLWREPVPLQLTYSYGMAIAYSSSEVWLSTPDGVWSAALNPSPLDLSEDVMRLKEELRPTHGEVLFELRNDDGRYLDPGSGPLELLQKGSEVRVSPGYRTSTGIETSTGPSYWIQQWEYVAKNGTCILALRALDWWGLLEGWRARRQFAWQVGEKSVADLLAFVLARVGLGFSASGGSTTLTGLQPAFTIHPGESARTAALGLLAMVPDVLIYTGSGCVVVNTSASDLSVYSYGTGHVIVEGCYSEESPPYNRVQVFGDGTFGEEFEWADMPLVYDHLRQVQDINLSDDAKVSDRLDKELRHQAITQRMGEIVVPVNAGQELYDVIDITDELAGLNAAKRRVVGMKLEYRATGKRPLYAHTLYLGGV